MDHRPGQLVLLGSGETSASGRRVFDWLFQQLSSPVRMAILETPAGFQPNSALVAQKVADYVRQHVSNHSVDPVIVPARRRGTPFSPDDSDLADSLLAAACIFLGPGSPTYAVRQLRGSIVWEAVRAGFASGTPLILASAAVLAVSAYTLPVYEIYKAGADLEWERGLDLLGAAGPTVVFVPHWNNREGGSELDTTHCFVGEERFGELRALLPRDATIVGIDEHTAFIVDPSAGTCLVMGSGGVTIERRGDTVRYENGESVPIGELAPLDWRMFVHDLPSELFERAMDLNRSRQDIASPAAAIPQDVLDLVQRREEARQQRDWKIADAVRAEVARRGYQIQDTPTGPRVRPSAE